MQNEIQIFFDQLALFDIHVILFYRLN
jgi:hypothetical protein